MEEIGMIRVQFLEGFFIRITMSDGQVIRYDFRNKLSTARFKDIDNWDVFCQGLLVDGKIIRWHHGIEILLDEILSGEEWYYEEVLGEIKGQ